MEPPADRELGGDLGDREARRLAGQRAGSAHPRVHLDHDHPARLRVDGELDVGTAGLDADRPNHGEAGIAHPLVLLVGERHRRGDGDRVTRMHAARIEVLDGADHDGVVVDVAHHLHLVFLPAEDRFLDEHLAHRREVEAPLDLGVELLAVVGHARARTAEREARPDHRRQPNLTEHLASLCQTPHDPAPAGLQPDLVHRGLEDLAVLAAANRLRLGADHLHAVLVEHAVLHEFHRQVERRLATERREHGVGLLDLDHLLEHLPGERLDVGAVSCARISHDRGRVRVDQHHPVAVLAEGLAGLGAGIVELAGLADDDGAGPDQENGVQVVSTWHGTALRGGQKISRR